MAERYCGKCRVTIKFVDNDTKRPICSHAAILETEQAKVERVRALFIKGLQNKSK